MMALGPDCAGGNAGPPGSGMTEADPPAVLELEPMTGAAPEGAVGLCDLDSGPLQATAYASSAAATVAYPTLRRC